MRTLKVLLTAAVTLALTLAVGAPTASAALPVPAQATTPPGSLTFNPTSGSDQFAPSVSTSAPCPASSNALHIRLTGPNQMNFLITARTAAGFSTAAPLVNVPLGKSFVDAAALNTPPTTLVAGTYTATLNCVSGVIGNVVQAGFVGNIVFSSPTAWTADSAGPLPPPGTATTTTALAVTPPSPAAGGAVETLTATLTPATATGSVQFRNGTTAIGAPVPVAGGKASTSTTLPAGTASLTAEFTGGTGFANSTSPAVSYVVSGASGGAAATTTTLATSPASPVVPGAAVELAATVSPSGAAGKVQFSDGDTAIGEPVPVTGGAASTTTSTLAAGTHPLIAVFTPTDSAAFAASTSSALTLVIAAPPGATADPDVTPAAGDSSGSRAGTASSGDLAFTGAPVDTLTATGLALSAAGIGLVVAARRRRVG